jgi:hypothetical protein
MYFVSNVWINQCREKIYCFIQTDACFQTLSFEPSTLGITSIQMLESCIQRNSTTELSFVCHVYI